MGSTTGVWNIYIPCQKVKQGLKNDGGMRKGHRSQFEGASAGQIWNNLSTKIENDSKGLELMKEESTCPHQNQ